MYSEEIKSSNLAKLLCNFNKVFLDTCSLMEDSFPQFMETLDNARDYWKDVTEIIVLGECLDELTKHSKSEDPIKRIEAKQALKILKHDRWHHKIIVHTKSSHRDSFADRAIYAKVSDLRIAEKILVITQDKKLTNDIRGLNKLESQKGRIINVYLINKNGDLEVNYGEKPFDHKPSRTKAQAKTNEPIKQKLETKKAESNNSKIDSKSPVILAEEALLSKISNPNYPVNKKIEDIDKQIELIKALKPQERSKLELKLTEDKLLLEKKRLQTPSEDKKKETKKQEQPKAQEPKAYYEFGKSPSQALQKLGNHYSWMFRDPSIAFVEGIHGKFDLTTSDLALADEQMSKLKVGEKKNLKIKKLVLSFEKRNTDFAASMKEIAEEKPKEVEKKPEASKPKKEKKVVASQKAPEKKAEKKLDAPNKNKAEKVEKKPAKAQNKPDLKPAKKSAETKGQAEAKAKKEVKRSAGFNEAVKNDKILNANINNPNYPKDNVLKDIEAQMYRVKHLKPGESKELLLGLKALDAKRAAILGENKK